jgi:hypothetical protein
VAVLVCVRVDVIVGFGVGVHRYGYNSTWSTARSIVIAASEPFCQFICCMIARTVSKATTVPHVGWVKLAKGIEYCTAPHVAGGVNTY